MNNLQIGRIVARALHRSSEYANYQLSVDMELSMCRYYGTPYSLDDEKVLLSALQKTAQRLSVWFGAGVEQLMDAYEDYAYSYCQYS
jgi:hypothetical protein